MGQRGGFTGRAATRVRITGAGAATDVDRVIVADPL
jgi:hypothetical protein